MAFFSGFCWATAAAATSTRTPSTTKPRARFMQKLLSGADDMVDLHPEDDPSLDRLDDQMEPDTEHGEQDQHREHARDVERGVELEDQVAEPALRADEFPDDRAEHAEHDGDVEPREHEGERVGERDQP